MKILQIHDYPPFEGGGIEINVSRVSRELVKAGHEVVIATSRFKSETYGGKIEEEFGGVRAILLEDLEKLEQYINWAEVVHIHFTFSCRPASMMALERCVEMGKKCIFSVHTNYAH